MKDNLSPTISPTSGKGFTTNRAGWVKDNLSHISEGELSSGSEDVPSSMTTMGPTTRRERKPTRATTTPRPGQNARQQTLPPQPQASISLVGASISNHGSGNVTTKDSGNIKDTTISNVGNNNSENYFGTGRPKPTYPTNSKEKKPTMTPRQNVRRVTAPAQLELPVAISGLNINNYGPGNVDSFGVGNVENTSISNAGNNNSKNFYRRKLTSYDGYGH